ncbi:MAG: LLM class F420-dependent oxidoreductase [Candidatus Tectimicrobiota bacterium]|nr:MAG: LLM class F420-dependent oxidoreductase [Candidatus Tectomicrobia bacterium]
MTRLGLALTGGLSPWDVIECVRLAEDLGYESAWIAEGHGGDQFALLAACALHTRRIRLGTGVSSVFVRSIPTLAMAAATVDHLAQGRFLLGLGSSHRVQVEPEHGLAYSKPVQRVRDSVAIIRALLRDGAVSYQGETVRIAHFDFWFTPYRPQIPIYLAALFPPMLEVCGELAEGVLLTRSTLATARQVAGPLATGARRAGRRPEEIDIASLLPCSVAASRQEALDALRPGVAFYVGFFPRYRRLMAESGFAEAAAAIHAAWQRGDRQAAVRAVPDALIASTGVVGTPAECQERLAAYRHSGIALPIISPFTRVADGKQRALEAIRACAP